MTVNMRQTQVTDKVTRALNIVLLGDSAIGQPSVLLTKISQRSPVKCSVHLFKKKKKIINLVLHNVSIGSSYRQFFSELIFKH